jgi:hypothetical protein
MNTRLSAEPSISTVRFFNWRALVRFVSKLLEMFSFISARSSVATGNALSFRSAFACLIQIACLIASLLFGRTIFAQRMNLWKSDLESEGMHGRVRMIREEDAYMVRRNGAYVEEQRNLRSITSYDSNGNVIEYTHFHSGIHGGPRIFSARTRYINNADGQLYEELRYDTDGSLDSRTRYILQAAQNRVIALHYLATGILSSERLIYLYADNGDILKLIQTGDPAIWIVFEYDDRGRRVGEVHCTARAGSINPDMSRPDSMNPCGSGRFSGRNNFAYDDRGNRLIEDIRTINQYITYEYEFDSRGNWTRKVESQRQTVNGREVIEPSRVMYRTIRYY